MNSYYWLSSSTSAAHLLTSPRPRSAVRPGNLPMQKRIVVAGVSHPRKDDFFGRERESSLLWNHLTSTPTGILLIMGPVSSGKTALLRNVLGKYQDDGAPVCYVDTRLSDTKNPSGMADALADNAMTDILKITKSGADFLKGISFKVGNGPFDAMKAIAKLSSMLTGGGPRPPLNIVMDAYIKVVRSARKDRTWPVLVIDEANTLSSWAPEHKDARASLLQFLIAISKQENMAHVILATSDWSFLDWLRKEVRPEFVQIHIIANFSQEDAKAFLERELGKCGKLDGSNLPEDVWIRIFEVSGGNVAKLLQSANNYVGDWDSVLYDLKAMEALIINDSLSPLPGAGWTKDQLLRVMRLLCQSKYGAVSRVNLESELGADGKSVVKALLKANVLGLRPKYSNWAIDLPVDAWDGDEGDILITAASATYQQVFREKLQKLDK